MSEYPNAITTTGRSDSQLIVGWAWISVKDRLPPVPEVPETEYKKESIPCLVWDGHEVLDAVFRQWRVTDGDGNFIGWREPEWQDSEGEIKRVTHWMYAPEPPHE